MTTKEFIKAVKELGYEAGMDDEWVSIVYKNKTLAHVFTKELYRMSSYFSNIDCGENAGILFALIFQYAVTPIKDRKEKEKKFYLRHRFLTSLLGDMQYSFINYDTKYNDIYLSSNEALDYVKTKFTLKEIEEIKKKFDTDLADFEMVEVEDED
ncbi:MAG: hypothetical protein E7C94_02450 [Finegoldia magna]|uniref:hypothetical protein n=1 Tax=Finegoldia magna TaxID=1260 RepID=UPI0028FE1C83|nr:hypothetical protein [Finegoldia magna]MDU2574770.1 hypothetical protein [Finegoldia magna]